ncbi:hypothetical protein F511_12472 [Dorcoceras hygrometricum]|uniref:Dystroglycan-like n=1 Tax=Dorcoceras hygrometricum TaxID=472368 RepID=A0A2Z7DIZ0_9LAMI|nr:hypothetical protein F511_12472 [Dorcoceras hygrometricum]
MDDPGMVSMFQALMASGLEGFLGCPAVLYEAALVYFFENGSVRDGLVVSTVNGVPVEITEQLFAEAFELPVDGLSELSEIPKDKVFDARSLVSLTGEPVSTYGKKSQMKIEYRLLCDIMEKTIPVKAGSFNSITTEKFLMLTAIVCGVRINWTSVLFNIFKKMVTPGTKQAKGFAIQTSLLLEKFINLELDESSEFPSSKILTERTIHHYIVLNDKVGAEEAADAPKVKKAPVQRAVSKKRPAAAAVGEPEAVPMQIIAPIPAAPAADETSKQPAAEHIDVQLEEPTVVEEIVVENIIEPAVEGTAEKIRPPTDDVDDIIEQVLAETAHIEADEEDHGAGTPDVEDQPAGTTVGEKQWFDLPNEDIFAQMDAYRPVVTPSDTDEEMETIGAGTGVGDKKLHSFFTADSRTDAAADYLVEEPEEVEMIDVPLPSTGVNITNIIFGKDIKIPGVDERTWYLASLPHIPVDAKGKEPLMEKDPVKGNPVKEKFLLILADIECLVQLREKIYNLFVLEELKDQSLAHGIHWEKTCCSKFFEGRTRDRCAVISQSNTNTKSSCWIRTMLRVGGTWVIEPCADYWKPIPREVSSSIVVIPSRLSYVDTLPPVSELFEVMTKRWSDVCLEVIKFFASWKLLPVGSVNFCRALSVVEPVNSFVLHQPTVFALSLSQFCTLFLRYSLFSRLSSVDIHDFVSTISMDRTILRNVQLASASVSSIDQEDTPFFVHSPESSFDISQRQDSPHSAADSPLRFTSNDISMADDTTRLSNSLSDLQTLLSERIGEDFRKLIQNVRQDGRNLDDVQTLHFNEFKKGFLAHSATVTADSMDFRNEFRALDAKETSLDEQVAATRNDLLEFRAQAKETLNHIADQLSEVIAYINRGGNDKKGEVSSSRPQPPPDDQNRGSGNACGGGDNVRTTNIVDRYSGYEQRGS